MIVPAYSTAMFILTITLLNIENSKERLSYSQRIIVNIPNYPPQFAILRTVLAKLKFSLLSCRCTQPKYRHAEYQPIMCSVLRIHVASKNYGGGLFGGRFPLTLFHSETFFVGWWLGI